MATKEDFDKALEVVVGKYALTDSEARMVLMHCEENGSDCRDRQWEVATGTLNEIIDQGVLMNVARNGTAY